MKMPKNTAKESSHIKAWYAKNFESDELGSEIKVGITFKQLFKCLDERRCVYDFLGVHDSVVRERVFGELAQVMKCDYKYIYAQWLLGGVKTPSEF
jgi:hypothetical protein